MLRYIILFPLLGAVINWLFGRKLGEKGVSVVACGVIFLSFAIACLAALGAGSPFRHPGNQPILDHLWTWIQVGNFRADFGLALDRLSGIYVLFITFVGLLIHIFATGYMRGDPGYYRFFAYLNLFMFSMLTLILGDNFLMMFVGWEGVGLCSYLLIGYYVDKDEARVAAKKAFVANRIGDWGVVLGVLLLFTLTGSISFFDKPAQGVTSSLSAIAAMPTDPATWGVLFAGGVTSIAILLFIGATGKSAQIPLFVWLPDAMAGPTPVSALIHAATMVTAGVYMVVRCNAIFSNAPTAMFIVAVIGGATALLAATIGLAQNDIKKVLAYSTVSQLGYMFLACGMGAYIAAIFHVMTHAFFKALLFLGSGSVIHGMHHEQDMRRMGGLKKYMPITHATMAIGWLAICGIFPFAGFFSKDEILWKTFSNNNYGKVFWFFAALTALMTAVYMTRLMYLTFWGAERFGENAPHDEHQTDHDDGHGHHHGPFKPHESPASMWIPLVFLAVLSLVGGWIGIPHALGGGNRFEHLLEPVMAHHETAQAEPRDELKMLSPAPQLHDGAPPVQIVKTAFAGGGETTAHDSNIFTERLLMGISLTLAALGILTGISIFKKDPLKKMPKLLENKWYVDEAYDTAIINPLTSVSRRGLWQGFDIGIIDGIVNGVGKFLSWIGGGVRYLQGGMVRNYAAFILLGALFVVGYFICQFVPLMAR